MIPVCRFWFRVGQKDLEFWRTSTRTDRSRTTSASAASPKSNQHLWAPPCRTPNLASEGNHPPEGRNGPGVSSRVCLLQAAIKTVFTYSKGGNGRSQSAGEGRSPAKKHGEGLAWVGVSAGCLKACGAPSSCCSGASTLLVFSHRTS